jgi:gliding motility-associated-like protein
MKKNTISLIFSKNLLILLFLTITFNGFGQVTSVTTTSTFFCRDATNQNVSFPVSFSFTTGTSNFSLEVSDANGVGFTPVSPTPTLTTSGLSGFFNFIMPSNFRGSGYIFRVKSSMPGPVSSKDSNPTELNFRGYTSALTYIPNVTTINFCGGGSFLRVDEGVIGIPNLTYKWYKGTPSTGVLITGETGPTLFIDGVTRTAGRYYAEIDYGICPTNSSSSIDVVFGVCPCASIFSTQGTTLTQGQSTSLKVTPVQVSGETYQWYKDGVLIAGATSSTYIPPTNGIAGVYKCLVINSSCQGFTNLLTLIVVNQPPTNFGPIPNVISPNGDGKNDTWELESTDYGPNTNTEITIVSSQGETVLKTNAYTNNWPTQTIDFGAINPVYYYIISKQGQDDKKGSITLIK